MPLPRPPRGLALPTALVALAALVVGAPDASAAPTKRRPGAPSASAPSASPESTTVPTPDVPAPSVSFALGTAAPRAQWSIRVENTGEIPVLLVADARLLTFEITPPPAPPSDTPAPTPAPRRRAARPAPPHVVRCALPEDERPTGEADHDLVLPPHRAYTETFDPRLYCFAAAEIAALVPGAVVTAHLGWTLPRRAAGRTPSAPFVVAPIDGVTPRVAPMKELVAVAVTLPAAPADIAPTDPARPAGPTATTRPSSDDTAPKLVLGVDPLVDAARPVDATLDVHVVNAGSRPASLLFRPATLAFDVHHPGAPPVRCPTRAVGPPIREVLTTLAPGGKSALRIILDEVCPEHTFDDPGLYVVFATLDDRAASGASIGVKTFDGIAAAPEPALVRIRRGPLTDDNRPRRPHLEPRAAP